MTAYKRILLKLSGEALLAGRSHGIDPRRLEDYGDGVFGRIRYCKRKAFAVLGHSQYDELARLAVRRDIRRVNAHTVDIRGQDFFAQYSRQVRLPHRLKNRF